FNIVSDGIVNGSIQVPGHGRPLILLADRHTTGGYPKIATVIGPDAARAAQLRSGQSVRFVAVTPEQAVAAARVAATQQDDALVSLADRPGLRTRRLLSANLVDGAFHTSDGHTSD
ncbi:MAG: urea amidolyase, partial [Actinomycetota bacterium]